MIFQAAVVNGREVYFFANQVAKRTYPLISAIYPQK